MNKCDFFIVGAPKCGTTSVYHYLDEHPDIFLSTPKEVNFFSSVDLLNQSMYYDDYICKTSDEYDLIFSESNADQIRGEASVSYLFYENVPSKIIKYNPQAKILIFLRNPVDRAFSHFLMDSRLGLCDYDFSTILHSSFKIPNGSLYYQQYIELGFYYIQVSRYLNCFKKENIHLVFLDDLISDLNGTLHNIFLFLGVDAFFPDDAKVHNEFSSFKNPFLAYLYKNYNLRKFFSFISPYFLKNFINKQLKSSYKPHIMPEDAEFLKQLYLDDICNLESLISVDLSRWKS